MINASRSLSELINFIAAFLAFGAVGFRYGVLGGNVRAAFGAGEEDAVLAALRRAARIGLLGMVVSVFFLAQSVPQQASRAHQTTGVYLTHNPLVAALPLLGFIGLALAAAGVRAGWPLAALGIIANPFRPILTGQWARLVNPVHVLAGGLWIGTLFMLVAAGLSTVTRSRLSSERRGSVIAVMVHSFSPLALGSFALLGITGVITAWLHLNPLSSLWTTPYGYTLIIKLAVVAVVVGLGAWNWRRQRPLLGTEAAAGNLRRSAVMELLAATLVLIITSVLVTLPSPKGAQRPPVQPGTSTAPRG